MIFRFIVVFIFSACVLLSQSFFDKLYIFGELNKKSGNTPYNELIGGLLVNKTMLIQNSVKLHTSLYVKSFNKNNGENSLTITPRELYARFNVDGFNVSVGKEIIDLSTSKIYSINTFLSPITSILDPLDQTLIYEGLNVATISAYANSSKAFLYVYQNKDSIVNALVKLEHNIKEVNANLFAGFDKSSEFFISTGLAFGINQGSNFYIEAKNQNDKQSYVIGADYTISNGVAIAIERIAKNQEFFDSKAVIEDGILKELPIVGSAHHLGVIGNLSGSNYMSLYIRVPYNNVSVNSFLGLYNMGDESKMIVIQNDYKFARAKVSSQLVKNISSNSGGEFGERASTTFLVHVSFAIL